MISRRFRGLFRRNRNESSSSSSPPEIFKRITKEKPTEHPTNSTKQIMNELKEFHNNTFSDEQIQLQFQNEDDPFHLVFILTPNDGLYRDGYFEILMTLSDNYPQQHPTLSALSPIFHPNISYDGNICFSLLNETGFFFSSFFLFLFLFFFLFIHFNYSFTYLLPSSFLSLSFFR